jgi:hypothetical protein
LEWSPLRRLISYNFLQQAEDDGDDAGTMIKASGNGTMPVALEEMDRQGYRFAKAKST